VGRVEKFTAIRAIGEHLVDRDTVGASPRFEVTVRTQRNRELHRSGRLVDAADAARRIVAMIDFEAEPVRTGHVGFDDVVLATDVSAVAAPLLLVGDWDGCRHVSRWVVDTFPADDPAVAPARCSSLGKLAIIDVLIGARRAAATLATEAIALCGFLQVSPNEVGYAQAALLVADPPADRARLHQNLERITGRMDLPSNTCLSDLLRAWAYTQDGELASARTMLDRAERSRASLAQPGMLVSLERRVRTIVESGHDEPVLGSREIEVLAALGAGCTRREAAEQLHLSLNTVKTYARRAYRCLGVSTLSEAIEKCSALGVDLEGVRGADPVAASS
jgi:DNA-binding CsgD family transcriptional regulator